LVSTGGSSTQQNNTNTTSSVTRSYPINTSTSVLKWRLHSRDIKWLPLIVSCWPVPSKDITLVTVEYELFNRQGFEVNNILIKIPIVYGEDLQASKQTNKSNQTNKQTNKQIPFSY
jgi:hypothetical protein